jgi:tetratricopeptide (TPR) repeat protein
MGTGWTLKKSTLFKKIFLLFLLSCFLVSSRAYSRLDGWHSYGPPEPSDDVATFIEPSVIGQSLFNYDYFLTDESDDSQKDHYITSGNKVLRKANVDEWIDYLARAKGVTATETDILEFIYESNDTNLLDESSNIPNWQKASTPAVPVTINPQLTALTDVKEYVDYIKQLNPVLYGMHGYAWHPNSQGGGKWGPYEGNPEKDLGPFVQTALTRLNDSNVDDFLKAKYAFQLIRLSTTLNKPDDAVKYFELYFGKSSAESLTRYRALGYRAKAYLQLNDKLKALRDYLDIIDQCSALRQREIESTRRAFSRDDFLNYASTLKSPHRLTTLYYVLGAHDPTDYSSETLEKLLEYGSNEVQTEAALIRTIRMIERTNFNFDRFDLLGLASSNGIKPPAVTPNAAVSTGSDPNKYAQWIGLCEKASELNASHQPALWAIAGSYLALLEGDDAEANKLFQKASQVPVTNPTLKNQIHLVETLIDLRKNTKGIPDELQERFLDDLTWAHTLQGEGNNIHLEHSLWVLLGQKYLILGDYPRAVLCFCSAKGADDISQSNEHEKLCNFLLDAIVNDEEMVRLQAMLRGKSLSKFDQKMVDGANLLPDDVQLIRAVREVRKDRYSEASLLLSEIPKSYFVSIDHSPQTRQYRWNIHDYFYGENSQIRQKQFAFFLESTYLVKMDKVDQDDDLNLDSGIPHVQLGKATTFLVNVGGPDGSNKVPRIRQDKHVAGQQKLGIAEYVKKMENLTKHMKEAKAARDPRWASMAYELASVLSSQLLTQWPEVRVRNKKGEDKSSFYPDYILDNFPLGIPTVNTDLKARYTDYQNSMQDYDEKAFNYCQDVVKDGSNREMAAKCQAFMAILSEGELGRYDPSDDDAQKYLSDLKTNFSDTAFYKGFVSWCQAVQLGNNNSP